MHYIGTIQFVQIQRESLKAGIPSMRRYDPAPLLIVARLKLTPGVVIGQTVAGEEMIDVHHTDHPRSRNRDDNFISMGFTGHYALMRERYGDHLTDGIAGENIIVAGDGRVTLDHLGTRLVVETQADEQITLVDMLPIPPCEPFSRFAARRDLAAPDMKAKLQYLSNGTRGFYIRLMSPNTGAIIQSGDKVYVAE